ncbi:MAG TPA: 3-hydroxybutyrate oligomer hydrolase family protein, partial [Candidatus Polarisedimenticolaceae bacterium]|nr:3-hydroxybutyrate oligomer hydrolase family protein [Candidatus Polarisedimenticolaceae bacterium]
MPRRRVRRIALVTLVVPLVASARADRCHEVLRRLGDRLVEATCVESPDLTTANPATTPANNSLPGLPGFAFTPTTDRTVIAPDPANKTPIYRAVPGIQIQARIAGDPTGQARFLLRLPDDWNGRLVVAGASGTRSEFNGDWAWSDYVVQKGYAYASQNKGVLNFYLSTADDPLGCRLNPASTTYVHFYDVDPGQPFIRWALYMGQAARIARKGVEARYGHKPRFTYAVGTSNGGYQVRRAVEAYPDLFDGGIDWEGTFVDDDRPNLLTDLPPAVLNWPDYVASGFNPDSTAAKNIRMAGYPPDMVTTLNGATTSFWGLYWAAYWEVTWCQWQKRLDPTYDTYGQGAGNYDYWNRLALTDVGAQLESFETTGRIHRPLITVAGTMDALLPIDHHARAYARKVEETLEDRWGDEERKGWGPWARRRPDYRLYEVQNGNHIETYKLVFPQLEFIEPHAQKAFDLLVQHVEQGQALPPSQCIPRGGAISGSPAQPGH